MTKLGFKELVFLMLFSMIIMSLPQKVSCTDTNSTGESPFQWLRDLIDRVSDEAFLTLKYALVKAYYLLLSIARVLYIVMGLAGAIAWLTGYSPYKGRRMLVGALLLAILTEAITRFNIHP